MIFPAPLIFATLIKRYKRFLADIEFSDGTIATAHCANPGSMLGLASPGSRICVSASTNPERKLKWSWELIEVTEFGQKTWVGINTSHPNRLVEEAIKSGIISELSDYTSVKREVTYGKNSRIDLLLTDDKKPSCYVEVKNVHLMRVKNKAEFPDSVTARRAKHLDEMGEMVLQGNRAVMVYLVQRSDAQKLSFAQDIDPAYARAFEKAADLGVEALAYCCDVSPEGITVTTRIPID